MKKTRRSFGLTAAALLATVLCPSAVLAVPVIDVSSIAQMVEQLRHMAQIYSQLRAQLTALKDAAVRLGRGNVVQNVLMAHEQLIEDVRSIGYRLQSVSSQFRQVFPDAQSMRSARMTDIAEMSRRWHGEIYESALVAARSQTTLSQLEANTRAAKSILERSRTVTEEDRGSQLAKLQALVQMIGLVNSDVATLASSLAATERVTANIAASRAVERQAKVERRKRLLRNYTKRRTRVDLDRRFLAP